MEDQPVKGQRSGPEEQRLQGHWLLAKMGKRVLRPGGIELTRKLVSHAKPSASDHIVEFGPGVGKTAAMLLAANPERYIGVDPNPEGTPDLQIVIEPYEQASLVQANAKDTGLPDESATLVVGEAMLTMHSDKEKLEIMREAFRILKPGGRYAIHELGFHPDDVDEAVTADVAKALSRTIKVGARPLTTGKWRALLEEAGFEVLGAAGRKMALLEPQRLIADEGWCGAFRFVSNVARNSDARKRILEMRGVFKANQEYLNAVAFVARKPV